MTKVRKPQPPPPIIALLTDFGDRDGFCGVLHGVIRSMVRSVTVVDVSHQIPPQDVRHGSWVLTQAFSVFPAGTFFVAVVDPGVGDPKQGHLAVYFPLLQRGIVCPDNGLVSRIMKQQPYALTTRIENPAFYRDPEAVSRTFHGRDIYAPVAAHMARAFAQGTLETLWSQLGTSILQSQLVSLPLTEPKQTTTDGFSGEVDVVDTFGNLISNLPNDWLPPASETMTLYHNRQTYTVHTADYYRDKEEAPTLHVVPGSHGTLEISAYRRSAQALLQADPADPIQLFP